jgi:hypothetical protein
VKAADITNEDSPGNPAMPHVCSDTQSKGCTAYIKFGGRIAKGAFPNITSPQLKLL